MYSELKNEYFAARDRNYFAVPDIQIVDFVEEKHKRNSDTVKVKMRLAVVPAAENAKKYVLQSSGYQWDAMKEALKGNWKDLRVKDIVMYPDFRKPEYSIRAEKTESDGKIIYVIEGDFFKEWKGEWPSFMTVSLDAIEDQEPMKAGKQILFNVIFGL